MEILQVIGVCIVILACIAWVYGIGIMTGKHRERMKLLRILQDVPMVGVSSQEKLLLVHTMSNIVRKLGEERA